MNWTTFLQAVSERSGVPRGTTRQVLQAAVAVAREELVAGRPVSLWGLGTLASRWQKPRIIRDIQSHRRLFLDGRHVAHFRPAAPLQRALAERTPQLWQDPDQQLAWRLSEALIGDLAAYHFASAPADLAADTPHPEVRRRCARAFGEVWASIIQTYDERIPPTARDRHDHLAEAVLRRWAPAAAE